MEKLKSIELILDKERSIYIENINICFDLMERAYERLFKMQYQVSTFSLVGIFTIFSWGRFQFIQVCSFPLGQTIFYISILIHIISLVFLSRVSRLSTELQVWKQELHKYDYINRQKTILNINSTTDDDSIKFLNESNLNEIDNKLKPYSDQINEISPKLWKSFKISIYIFYASVISTTILIVFNLKIS